MFYLAIALPKNNFLVYQNDNTVMCITLLYQSVYHMFASEITVNNNLKCICCLLLVFTIMVPESIMISQSCLKHLNKKTKSMFKMPKMPEKRICCCINNPGEIVVKFLHQKYCVNVSRKSFQSPIDGQYFWRKYRLQIVQSSANCDVILHPVKSKIFARR